MDLRNVHDRMFGPIMQHVIYINSMSALKKILAMTASQAYCFSEGQRFNAAPRPPDTGGMFGVEADRVTAACFVHEQVLKRAGVAGFQIRAMDAAVCALWALCRHWQDPKAAIIAAVRGAALATLIVLKHQTCIGMQICVHLACTPQPFRLKEYSCTDMEIGLSICCNKRLNSADTNFLT